MDTIDSKPHGTGRFQYSHNDIQESAQECYDRRKQGKEISKDEFTSLVGESVWQRFSKECIGSTSSVAGFYASEQQGKSCVYVEAGNIDRVFAEAV